MRHARWLVVIAGAVLALLLRADGPPSRADSPLAQEVRAHFDQGVLMLHARRYDLAAIALRRAGELAPHVPQIHANLGFAFLGLEQWTEAQLAFERALELDARQINAYYGLANAAEGRGDRELALGAMRSFVHLASPDDRFLARARAALWEWRSQVRADATQRELRDVASFDLGQWRGRVAIVNIWAIWCAPCRAEMPDLERLSRELDASRFVVVGIAAQSDAFVAREWLHELEISFPNLLDERAAVVGGRWGVKSYPETLVFDADGQLAMRLTGVQNWNDPGLRERIAALSRDSQSTPTAHQTFLSKEQTRR